ncbi:MAG: tetratricopeptide repeat protein, partial [Bacteroidota bacterium]
MKKEEILAAYIEKVLNTQDEVLSETHLKKVAFELGLDEAAFKELQQVYRAHLTRGNTFYEHGNWEEAIEEYRHAIDLNPLKVEGLMAQSRAYEAFWRESGKKVYKEEALYYA